MTGGGHRQQDSRSILPGRGGGGERGTVRRVDVGTQAGVTGYDRSRSGWDSPSGSSTTGPWLTHSMRSARLGGRRGPFSVLIGGPGKTVLGRLCPPRRDARPSRGPMTPRVRDQPWPLCGRAWCARVHRVQGNDDAVRVERRGARPRGTGAPVTGAGSPSRPGNSAHGAEAGRRVSLDQIARAGCGCSAYHGVWTRTPRRPGVLHRRGAVASHLGRGGLD